MNSSFTSSVARNAAAILFQHAGALVAVYFILSGQCRRMLVFFNPALASPLPVNPLESNLLMIWDAEAGAPFPLPLDQVTHIVAGGKTYRVRLPLLSDKQPALHYRRRYRWRSLVA